MGRIFFHRRNNDTSHSNLGIMELQLNQGKEMSHLRNLQIAKKNASLEECFQVNSL